MKIRNAVLSFALGIGLAVGAASLATPAVEAYAYYGGGTTDTFRVWLNRGGHWADTGSVWKLYYGGRTTPAEPSGYCEVMANNWLVYFDVEFIDGVVPSMLTFAPYTNSGATDSNVRIDVEYTAGDNAEVYYAWYDQNESKWNASLGPASQDGAEVKTAAIQTALYAYYTCSDNADNGYGNIDKLISTWTTNAESGYGEAQVADYAYGPDYDYGTDTKTEAYTTVSEKLAKMQALAGGNVETDPAGAMNGFFSDPTNIAGLCAGLLASLSVAGFVIYFVSERRKKSQPR